MPVRNEIRRRVPLINRAALEIPAGCSIFESIDGGRPVDAAVFSIRDGHVLIGRAETHQSLIDRYAPGATIDDYVRADLFGNRRRVEMDTCRAGVVVDSNGAPEDEVAAWEHLYDAVDAFRRMGMPGDWCLYVDGEEVGG